MNMYKVVLVDDEELIIEGMKQLVDWESLGCRIEGAAYDGDEALDIINETEPDIIITDIRMPSMNGLEMIDHVKEQFPDVVIMIMSGYSDFEYAQKALEKGAACYMLKPVLEKDLRERILQAVKKLDEKRLQKQKEEEATVRLYHLKRGAKENFLRKLLREDLSPSHILHMWENMELCPPKSMAMVALLDTDIPLRDTEQAVIKFAIDNMIEEICLEAGSCECVSLGNETSAILFLYTPSIHLPSIHDPSLHDPSLHDPSLHAPSLHAPSSHEVQSHGQTRERAEDSVQSVISRLLDTVKQFCRVPMSAGISSGVTFPDNVRTAYTEAEKALERRFYESGETGIYQGGIQRGGKREDVDYKELLEWKEKLLDAVQHREQKNAMVRLGRFCHGMFDGMGMEREGIYTEIIRLLTDYQGILLQHQIENGAYDTSQIFQPDYLYQFKTSGELRRWLETVTEQIIAFLGQESLEASTRLIDRMKHYISQNYQTVTRQKAADYFFLNPSYLSQLFKSETGEAFTDYVTQVRMEEARRLLSTTDHKIQYIAELVGYTSNQHFTRTFKKYAGMLPVEYRKHK